MAKDNRKSVRYNEYDYEEWLDDEMNDCSKQDMQKIKAIEKREYKNKRFKQRRREGEFY